jgi:hypothetical protein
MLLSALALPYYLALCWVSGVGLERRVLGLREGSLTGTTVSGLAFLSTALTALSLAFPICPWLHLCVLGTVLVYCVLDRKLLIEALPERPRSSTGTIIGIAAVLPVLWLAAGPPLVYDTGFYHAQAVRWLNEYGTVPGLANLHGRLGFNSVWFPWAAFWDHGPLDGKSCHLVDLGAWIIGWGLFCEALLRLRRPAPADLVQLGVVFPLLRFEHYAASLSPELPCHVFLVYTTALLIRLADSPDRGTLLRIGILSGFLPALKLSLAPAFLALGVAAWLVREARLRRTWLAATGLALGALIPFLARGVMLTGYLLYPLNRPDLFTGDWKVPPATAELMRQEVRGWAIEPWAGPAAASRPLAQWIEPWLLRHVQRHPVDLAAMVIALALAIYFLAQGPRRNWPIVALAMGGVLYWFVSAPDIRFGFGWILALALVCLSAGPGGAALLSRLKRLPCLSIAAAWSVVGALLWAPHLPPLLMPAALPQPAFRSVVVQPGFTVLMPVTGDQTWDAPLPNTPIVAPGLQLRGAGLRHGFRIREP